MISLILLETWILSELSPGSPVDCLFINGPTRRSNSSGRYVQRVSKLHFKTSQDTAFGHLQLACAPPPSPNKKPVASPSSVLAALLGTPKTAERRSVASRSVPLRVRCARGPPGPSSTPRSEASSKPVPTLGAELGALWRSRDDRRVGGLVLFTGRRSGSTWSLKV